MRLRLFITDPRTTTATWVWVTCFVAIYGLLAFIVAAEKVPNTNYWLVVLWAFVSSVPVAAGVTVALVAFRSGIKGTDTECKLAKLEGLRIATIAFLVFFASITEVLVVGSGIGQLTAAIAFIGFLFGLAIHVVEGFRG